ncbi:MAG: nitroreductase family protein [Polyangiaceae bacterium]
MSRDTDVPTITIDEERCRRDGVCIGLCPVRVFARGKDGLPEVAHPEECCACGHCIALCPKGAILHDRFDRGQLSALPESEAGLAATAKTMIAGRRSIRRYRKEVPSRERLNAILDAAAYAPGSPHRRVGWTRSFVVVSGRTRMAAVRELTVDYLRRLLRLINGPLVRFAAHFDDSARAARTVAADIAMRLDEWEEGRDSICHDAPAAIFAHAPIASSTPQADCDAAMTTVLLMAHAQGLGTCWNGLMQGAAAGEHLRRFSALAEYLGIPEGHRCYAAATVGEPAVRFVRAPRRSIEIRWLE